MDGPDEWSDPLYLQEYDRLQDEWREWREWKDEERADELAARADKHSTPLMQEGGHQ